MNSSNGKTRFELPVGSLQEKERGDIPKVLKRRLGWIIQGYDNNKLDLKEIQEFEDENFVFDIGRPQNLPIKLSYNMVDIGISGEDCMVEGMRNGYEGQIKRLCKLGTGKVKIVVVAHEKHGLSLDDFIEKYHEENKILRCFTEYPHIAFDWISKNKIYQQVYHGKRPVVEMKGTRGGGINTNVQIIWSFGKSEGLIREDNIGVENTQTGKTLKAYNLAILEEIMESEAGIYYRKNLIEEPERYEQIMKLKERIEGSAN